MSAPTGRCPRCQSELAPGQDWCTTCGYAATTRILRPGNWRVPIIIATVVFVLGLGGVAAAFVAVSGDTSEVTTTTLPPKTLPATGTASTPTASTPTTSTPTTSTPTASTPTSSTPTTSTPTASTPTTSTAKGASTTPTTSTPAGTTTK